MKVRRPENESTGPARPKRKKPPKLYLIESRYIGPKYRDWLGTLFNRDWRVRSYDRFAKRVDRDHQLAKHQRSARPLGRRWYEYRAVDLEGENDG